MDDDRPAAGPAAGFVASSRVAGYLLHEQIGSGGMAVVFRALDERLQRQVALKILLPALAADESFRHRFIRESRSAAAVDHPHIIPVFEAGEQDGVLFLAMRYVLGGDAGTLVRRLGPLPAARAAAIVSAVASALDAAHAAGLVHRDVKPANMLVDMQPGEPDHVYLSDFGITKGALTSADLTGTGHFLGTLDYCAPEQIEGRAVDGRTDEYALACAAIELLTGEPPFPRDKGMAVAYAQLSAPPPRLTSRRRDLPAAIDEVLLRALAKDPGDRYARCGDFASALRTALEVQQSSPVYSIRPAADHPPTDVAPTGEPGSRVTEDAMPQRELAGQATESSGRAVPALLAPVPPVRRGYHPRRVVLLSLAGAIALAAGSAAAVFASTSGSPGHSEHSALVRPVVSAARTSRQATPSPSPSLHGSPGSPRLGRSTSPHSTAAGSDSIARILSDPGPGTRQVSSVAFSGNGATIATGDMDGNAYLWSTGNGRQIAVLRGSGNAKVFSVAISPDGSLVAAGAGSGMTYLWQAATGQLITSVSDPGGQAVNSVAFSPDGRTLATGDFAGSTSLWDLAGSTTSPARTFAIPGGQYVTAVAFGPDSQTLAAGSYSGAAYLWNLRSGARTVIPEPGTVWAVTISSTGMLAIGDANGITYLWSIAAGTQSATLTDPASGSQGVGSLAFTPDGRMLATGDSGGSAYLWRIS